MNNNVIKSKQQKPIVSVVMNCCNCAKYLKEAIDSVYSQTVQDWEIILWDNASTEKIDQIVNSYDERLRYFRGEQKITLGAARNKALEHAVGEYIAFLDCDDIWYPEKLEKQLLVFKFNSNVKFVYGNFYNFVEASGSKKRTKFVHPKGDFFAYSLFNYNIGMLTSIMSRAELMKMEELFDENLTLSEEYELFMRFIYFYEAACVDDPLGECRIHPKSSSKTQSDKWAYEIQYILDKFERIIPGFQYRYPKQIEVLMAKIQYYNARYEMRLGNKRKAREILKPVAFVNHVFFVLYLLTFLPMDVWKWAHKYRPAG
ncbi:MAG: glycosyltransferase [Magnetococcus sp. YQC-5]